MNGASDNIRDILDSIYKTESRCVFATLVRLLGDFDLAEEAMHDAFAAATDQWLLDGPPRNPRACLVSVDRFRAIDQLRRRTRLSAAVLAGSRVPHPFYPFAQKYTYT